MNEKHVEYGGVLHAFPGDFTDDDISGALAEWDKSQSKAKGRALLKPTIEKLGRTINTPAGGMGYGESPVAQPTNPGFAHGAMRMIKGAFTAPFEAASPTPHDEVDQGINSVESGMQAGGMPMGVPEVAGTAARVMKRLLIDPSTQAAEKEHMYDLQSAAHPEQAYDDMVRGTGHMANMFGFAKMVPGVGPLAANMVERAVAGDPKGAAGEMSGALAVPKILEKTGGLAKSAVGKLVYPMADSMRKTPSGTGEINPTEAFTPAEIKEFAEDPGQGTPVPMTPAEITESGGLRAVQGVGQKSLFGKGRLQKHQAAAQSAVISRVRGLMQKLNPKAANAVQIGRELQGAVGKAAKAAKAEADMAYAKWRQTLPGGVGVDLTPLQEKYGNQLTANSDVFDNIPREQAGRLKSAMSTAKDFGLKSVEDGEMSINPVVDLETAREMRSHWLDAKREITRRGRADSREAALHSEIVGDLDAAVEDSLRKHGEANSVGDAATKTAAGDNLVNGWREANAKYRQYVEDFYGDDSVLSDIADTPSTDLVKLPGKILEKGAGGNPVHLEQLRKYGISLGGLQREVADRALNSGFRTSQNKLAGFDDDFLQSMFADNPKDLEALYKNARIGRSVGVDFNPSNTAGALAGREEFAAPVRAGAELAEGNGKGAVGEIVNALPGYAAARFSTSPWIKRWLTRTPEGPVGRWLTKAKGGSTPPTTGTPPSSPPPAGPTPGGLTGGPGRGTMGGGQGGATLMKKAESSAPGLTVGSAVSDLKTGKTIDLRKAAETGELLPPDIQTANEMRQHLANGGYEFEKTSGQSEIWKHKNTGKREAFEPRHFKETREQAETEAGNTSFDFGANKLKKSEEGESGPRTSEGPATPGRGPGAMLRRGSKLMMQPGPHAGSGTILYHGTSADALPSILNEGLRNSPDIAGKNSANVEQVNLTRDLNVAKFYAETGADAEGNPQPQKGAILAVEVPRSAIDTRDISREAYRRKRAQETGEWPTVRSVGGRMQDIEHEGLHGEPGEFRIVRSEQPVPPEMIKGVITDEGKSAIPMGSRRVLGKLLKTAQKLREPEGAAKPGTGPGAMLAKGSKLAKVTDAGPMTGGNIPNIPSGKVALTPAEGNWSRPGYTSYRRAVVDERGKNIADVTYGVEGDEMIVFNIDRPFKQDFDAGNLQHKATGSGARLGPSVIRQLLEQVRLDHPEVRRISGERVTGMGSRGSGPEGGRETVIKLRKKE